MRTADKRKLQYNALNALGIFLLAFTIALIIWSRLLKLGVLQLRYAEIQNMLYEFQLSIASLEDKWLIFIIIEILFIAKSIIPIPISLMFVISGMVFPYSYAVLINALGMILLIIIKYLWGFKFGTGKIDKKLLNITTVQKILNKNYSKGVILFSARLIPWIPVNKISQLYGAVKYPFDRYLYISIIAFTPRVLVYSVIGRNVFDPFSTKFLLPLTVISAVGGISLITLNKLFDAIKD